MRAEGVCTRRDARAEPIAPNPARQADFAWDTFARACKAAATSDGCEEGSATCEGPPGPGFQQCILREGEHDACPAATPELRRFHGTIDDRLSCTPCTCTLPEDTGCRIFVGIYRGNHCVSPWLGTRVSFEEPFCDSTDVSDRYASVIGQIHPVEPAACIAEGGQSGGSSYTLASDDILLPGFADFLSVNHGMASVPETTRDGKNGAVGARFDIMTLTP